MVAAADSTSPTNSPHTPSSFYVYTHRRAADGVVFYVGKGRRNRAWSTSDRTEAWHRVSREGYFVQVECGNLAESAALHLERIMIAALYDAGVALTNTQIPAIPFTFSKANLQQMSSTVRPRGTRWELRVRHRNLPKPFYFTFNSEIEARSYGDRLESLLNQGFVPPELLAPSKRDDDPLIGDVISTYIDSAPGLTPSDTALLTTMLPQVVARMSVVNYQWAEGWVANLKSRKLAPGTIRKYVGALARVIDWHHRCIQSSRQNPLRMLPRGYSQYDHRDAVQRTDVKRDRRLAPGEYGAILELLPDDLGQLFQVLCWTGLRLREAYRLRVDQIDTAKWVIRVEGTKGARGASKPRVVPVVPELRPILTELVKGRVGRLWGFWDGDPATLDNATARLSQLFAAAFARAGIRDLVAHDLRHEACCRWVERRDGQGRWVFSDIEVARIMGWSSLRMMMRYASLRGEDLASRLG